MAKRSSDISQQPASPESGHWPKSLAGPLSPSLPRLLARIGHDLRQPLQAMALLNAALAQRTTDDDTRLLIDDMGRSVDVLRQMIENLLDLGKLEAGAVDPEIEVVPVSEVLVGSAKAFSQAAAATDVGLRIVDSGAWVRSDARLLRDIVTRLVSNAVRFTAAGKIVVGCRRRGATLRIEVWDTGPGIGDDDLRHVFEAFHRLDIPGGDTGPGLGLGLALVERTATLLGHSVEARSWPGKGSMFAVVVPLAVADGDDLTAAGHRPPVERIAGSRILVAADGAETASLCTLLTRWRARVLVAPGAGSGRQPAVDPECRPDLIIADCSGSDFDAGIRDLCGAVEAIGCDTPRLLICDNPSSAMADQARRVGIHLLGAPVAPGKLRALLEHLLDGRR